MNLPVLSEATQKAREPFKEPLVYFHIYKAIKSMVKPPQQKKQSMCSVTSPSNNPTLSDCTM